MDNQSHQRTDGRRASASAPHGQEVTPATPPSDRLASSELSGPNSNAGRIVIQEQFTKLLLNLTSQPYPSNAAIGSRGAPISQTESSPMDRQATICWSGEGLSIVAGVPSACGIFLRPRAPLTAPVRLSEGDRVWLGEFASVALPRAPISNGSVQPDASSQLTRALQSLAPGESRIVGREDFPALGEVARRISRAHLTIQRLEDDCAQPVSRRQYLVTDGVRSIHRTFISTDGKEWRQVEGRQPLRAGDQLRFGEDSAAPVVRIPDYHRPVSSLAEIRTPISEAEIDRNVRDLRTRIVNGEHNAAVSSGREILVQHLVDGFALLRATRFADATEHFLQPAPLFAAGYRLEVNLTMAIQPLGDDPKQNDTVVTKAAQRIAASSWFTPEDRTVRPSMGLMALSFSMSTASEEQRRTANNLQREVALITAEEFIHALQHSAGDRCISRYGERFAGLDRLEHDVAQLFREHGVPHSALFLGRSGRDAAVAALPFR